MTSVLFTVAYTFLWTVLSPARNQITLRAAADSAKIQTAVIQVLSGTTNYSLIWKYTLPTNQSLRQTFFIMDDGIRKRDVAYVLYGERFIPDAYQSRFTSVVSTNEFSALTIKKVTKREKATFQCRIYLTDSHWVYNIWLDVKGKISSRLGVLLLITRHKYFLEVIYI